MIYLLDTNIFLQAYKVYYPMDVVVSFWETLKKLAQEEKIFSINYVKSEIDRYEDELQKWCETELPDNFFLDVDAEIYTDQTYQEVINWAVSKLNNPYLQRAIDEFSSSTIADAFLVAFALSDRDNRVIVTEEKPRSNSKSKIKIPDVCKAFEIKYLNTIDMFRELKVKF